MNGAALEHDLEAYQAWKTALRETILNYQDWLDAHGEAGAAGNLPILETLEALRTDRLTLAFVAEFSRGKSELINAIFFADHKRRLLPSEAGRTTMCPTELFYDHDADAAYIQLLPIESRASDLSISQYKHDAEHWNRIMLTTDNPDRLAAALAEVTRIKRVSVDEARRLGLYNEELAHAQDADGMVEIPHWRHALISFPHPLLKQGLVILDTPGLNALGNEPELTVSMLPAAQAVLFVLAADTGVSSSDMDIWRHHIKGQRARGSVLVALNKIDTLWDELKDTASIDNSIAAQRTQCAGRLGITPGQVFPISAQKALVAKVRGDELLLARSRLPELEQHLRQVVLPERQRILRDSLLATLGGHLDATHQSVAGRHQDLTAQLEELRSVRGKNADVVMQLMRKTREEQTAYMKSVENFQTTRCVLTQHTATLLENLDPAAFDRLVSQTHDELVRSWTTRGLRQGMQGFFAGLQITLQEAVRQGEAARNLILGAYRRFHEEHGLPAINPKPLAMKRYYVEIDRLAGEAEEFCSSPAMAMTEQVYVIKKFFSTLVHEARAVFSAAHAEAESWSKDVLDPLLAQIQAHKQHTEKRLETLRDINESREELEGRIREVEGQCATLATQLDELDGFSATLRGPSSMPAAVNPVAVRAG